MSALRINQPLVESLVCTGRGTMCARLDQPIDIAIPLREGTDTVNCFWAPPVESAPITMGDFVGDVRRGGSVNFRWVRLTPHGNGTHTECVGHISPRFESVNDALQGYHYVAQLMSLWPERMANGDRVLTLEQIKAAFDVQLKPQALVIRTMPNDPLKRRVNYSGTNPPYLHHEAAAWLVAQEIDHLLVDLPSVDREDDGGKLLAHKAFWAYPHATRDHATITELIYVPDEVPDGPYLLALHVAPLELDAVPARPLLFSLSLTTDVSLSEK